MVREQLEARGITDERVLDAFASVPRDRFVAEADRPAAYEDHPLPIGVSASAPRVPRALVAQLAPGGRLVVPIGSPSEQELVRVRLDSDGRARAEHLGAVRFVPLLGEEGWQA